MSAFEVWESPDGQARFYFSHFDKIFTAGVMMLRPGAQLPKHNRPLAVENLVQVGSECQMTLLDDHDEIEEEHVLKTGDTLRMKKGQWHIHANPFPDISLTLFKAEGDITTVMAVLRESFTKIL